MRIVYRCTHVAGTDDTVQYADERIAAGMFGGVWVYLRLRYQRQANLFRQYIGSGDVWFLLLLTPLFALPVYVVLLLCGFACGLLYGTFVRIFFRKETTIPLVTFLSLPLTAYMSYRFYLSLP